MGDDAGGVVAGLVVAELAGEVVEQPGLGFKFPLAAGVGEELGGTLPLGAGGPSKPLDREEDADPLAEALGAGKEASPPINGVLSVALA